ncbi:hypothetical protein D3C74_270640 [compost metagenome]
MKQLHVVSSIWEGIFFSMSNYFSGTIKSAYAVNKTWALHGEMLRQRVLKKVVPSEHITILGTKLYKTLFISCPSEVRNDYNLSFWGLRRYGGLKLDLESMKQEILEKDEICIYRNYLLGNEVWYYKEFLRDLNYSRTYDNLKHFISDKLRVHFNDIAIFGSAKTGYSFSPEKNFKLFDDSSDIDITVVSQTRFMMFWNAYAKMHTNSIRPISEYGYVAKCIFQKFITFKGFDLNNDTYKNWYKQESDFKKNLQLEFNISQDINYRIFESWDAVQSYYTRNIKILKSKLGG